MNNFYRVFILFILIVLSLILCSCEITVPYIDIDGDEETSPTKEDDFEEEDDEPIFTIIDENIGEEQIDGDEVYEITSTYEDSGVFCSSTGTTLNLICEWTAKQNPQKPVVDVSVNLYLEFGKWYSQKVTPHTFSIGGNIYTFQVGDLTKYDYGENKVLIFSRSEEISRPNGEDMEIPISARFYYDGKYDDYYFDSLQIVGNIYVTDEYENIPPKLNLSSSFICQNPELPNGCEVTSLTMLLNYYRFDIDKITLKDNYLPIGETNFYKHNIKDPASTESYGCYSPVIEKTATLFLKDQNSNLEALDITHCNESYLFLNLYKCRPIVAWITEDLQTAPYIITTFEDEHDILYWKHPLHCVLITGYDKSQNLIYYTDPIKGPMSYDADTFLLRWHQMGEQAVIIK